MFFAAPQHDVVADVMRTLQVGYNTNHLGYHFDAVEYTPDHRLARLSRGSTMFHIPTANILMVVGDDVEGM